MDSRKLSYDLYIHALIQMYVHVRYEHANAHTHIHTHTINKILNEKIEDRRSQIARKDGKGRMLTSFYVRTVFYSKWY